MGKLFEIVKITVTNNSQRGAFLFAYEFQKIKCVYANNHSFKRSLSVLGTAGAKDCLFFKYENGLCSAVFTIFRKAVQQ